MENLGKLFLFFIGIALAFLVALLGTHVILSIAELYKIEAIIKYDFVQMYGVLCVLSIVFYRHKKEEEDNKEESALARMFIKILTSAVFYLVSWGLSFLTYYILT